MLVTVFVCLLGVAFLVLGGVGPSERQKLVTRVERYGPHHNDEREENQMAQAAVGWVTQWLGSGDREQRLAKQLDLAGIKIKPAEFVVLACCGTVALAALLTVLSGNPLGALAGLLVGALGFRLGINFKIGRRRSAFGKQLPDVLQLIAGSLSSGFSLPQALAAFASEDTQPAAAEFQRALAQTRYGVNLENALDQLADRMESTDLRWAVMAVRIQRTVGGNLAEVLSTTVTTMRERATLRGQVRALSAEGRLSGIVLILMPIAIGGWLFLTRRSYLEVLWTTTFGIIMLIGAVVMLVVGTFWMRKIINIDV
jgi:tight adherence protein B